MPGILSSSPSALTCWSTWGLICHENMQIEGFWFYLFSGVFEAATIHYAMAKIFGPLIFVAALFLLQIPGLDHIMFIAFTAGNVIYYVAGIVLAFFLKDNRAFCKYLCPITVFLKPMSYFSLIRIKPDETKCIHCGKCNQVCPKEALS